MNLISRSVTRVLSSSLDHSRAAKLLTRKWLISRQITSGGGAEAPDKESASPKNVEYQQELSSSISLIGLVDEHVQFGSSSDGKFWAGTNLSHHESKHSSFWVPIIFEGDLARTAVQHLKKYDRIQVSGKLFPNRTYPKYNVQVWVQTLNLVHDISPADTEKKPSKTKRVRVMDEKTSNAWKDLLVNPKEWQDHRRNKANGLVKLRHPDFKRKGDGLALWLGRAPDWVLPSLEGLEFGVPNEHLWKDLAENPHKWWDNRWSKTNPRAPDFKQKNTGEGLWMSDSPTWVLSKLPPLKKKKD